MSDKITYKGFEIEATPKKLQDGDWNHDGYIVGYCDGMQTHSQLSGGTSKSKEEAVRAIFALGKKMIDRQA